MPKTPHLEDAPEVSKSDTVPPQLDSFYVEEQWLYSVSLTNDQTHPFAKDQREPRHT